MKKFSLIFILFFMVSNQVQSQVKINTAKINLELKILELQAKIKLINMMQSFRGQLPYYLRLVGNEILFLVKSQIPYKYYREYRGFLDKYNQLYDSYESGNKKLFKKTKLELEDFTKKIKNKKFKNLISPYVNKIKWTGKYATGNIEETNPLTDISFIFYKIMEDPLEKSIEEKDKTKDSLKKN